MRAQASQATCRLHLLRHPVLNFHLIIRKIEPNDYRPLLSFEVSCGISEHAKMRVRRMVENPNLISHILLLAIGLSPTKRMVKRTRYERQRQPYPIATL